ncbi:MAG: SDR family NAD(P)-dependent oxidoreductase [Polyangiales bacterium]
MASPLNFARRYGAWALIAGASDGLGAAFAHALAARGLKLVIIARRENLLEELAAELRSAHGVEVRTLALDLATPDLRERLANVCADIEVGLAIHNAAFAPVGAVLERELDDLLKAVDVNVRAPLTLVHALAPAMVARGRGGILLMSSLAGLQGSPRLATYAGTKAFNNIFGEALWHELRDGGVDVEVCCAGAIRTPGFAAASTKDAPGTLDAEVVAQRALDSMARGPVLVPGFVNRIASLFLGLLPRRWAVAIMAKNTKDLS